MTRLTTGKIHSPNPLANISARYLSGILAEDPNRRFFNFGRIKYHSVNDRIEVQWDFGSLLSRQEIYNLFTNPTPPEPHTGNRHFVFVTNIDILIRWTLCDLTPDEEDDDGFLEPNMDGTTNTEYYTIPCMVGGINRPNQMWFDATITRNGVDVIHHYLKDQPLTLSLGTADDQLAYRISQNNIFSQVQFTSPFDTRYLSVGLSNDATTPNTLSFELLQPFNTQTEPFRILPTSFRFIGHYETSNRLVWHVLNPPSFAGVRYYRQNNRYPTIKDAVLAQMAVFDQEVREHSQGRMTFTERVQRERFLEENQWIWSDDDDPPVVRRAGQMQVAVQGIQPTLSDIEDPEDPSYDPSNDI